MTVAGYSGTPLPRKLGIRPGHRVLILGAPAGFEADVLGPLPDGVRVARSARGPADVLGPLPDGVRVARSARGPADVIVSFHTERRELARRMPRLRELMEPAAGLWIAWPKRASGKPTDLTEDIVRELALDNRLVDNKVAAVDGTWSGLRLVIRLRDRR